MADQELIQKVSEEISLQIVRVKEEIIDTLFLMTENKTQDEALILIDKLNIDSVVMLKSQSALSSFKQSLFDVLKSKRTFGDVKEEVLNVFYNTAVKEITEELKTIGALIQKEFVNAILHNKTKEQIIRAIDEAGYGA